ncbi:MAG TPA: ATP-dependent metallopeptidase FtsH/Yme1/Tma family protein [Spirochaetes bacterium]|nr:ATP-dependent metallopeptidase FtsH/Yme1/Tma family protein [Spirochaetota bacterium]
MNNKKSDFKSFKPSNRLAIIAIIGLIALFLMFMFNKPKESYEEVDYSNFIQLVKDEKVQQLRIIEKDIYGYVAGGEAPLVSFHTIIPYDDQNLIPLLLENNVEFKGAKKKNYPFLNVLISIVPWILILGIFWFIMLRQIQGTSNKALSFGKSKARLQPESKKKFTFKDVAGVEEAKEELGEVIDYLKDTERFTRLGAKIPKGLLLIGPPGTGKTLLAKAISGEADVPFFSMSGSDFVEMFVGVGASRVRDLFEQGKKASPCIIFIDELDAVGRVRGAGYGGGHDEREQTLNQLLVEMDGFEENEGVIVLSATNRPDVLDPALLRPGRFDRQVVVDVPDIKGREGILKVHSAKVPVAKSVVLKVIARGTPGFTGADLANLVNEAALLAARKGKRKVGMDEFEFAKDKVLMGPERRSIIISEEEKTVTSFHESGHAILGMMLPNTDPIHKMTIIPRGLSLGMTQSLPETDKHNLKKDYIIDQITLLMGGRVAEEIRFGNGGITTGAQNDIERATSTARKMVCVWGMGDKVGPLQYGQKEEPIFIGKEIARHKDYSEKTAEMIDEEIKEIVEDAYSTAWEILTKNKTNLNKLAMVLLDKEVLDRKEIEDILNIKKAQKNKKNNQAENNVLNGKENKKKSGKEKMTLGKIRIATNEAGGE